VPITFAQDVEAPLPAKLVRAAQEGKSAKDLHALILHDLELLIACSRHDGIMSQVGTRRGSGDLESEVARAAVRLVCGGKEPASQAPRGTPRQRQFPQPVPNPRRCEALGEFDIDRLANSAALHVERAARDWWQLSGWRVSPRAEVILYLCTKELVPVALEHHYGAHSPNAHIRGAEVTARYRDTLDQLGFSEIAPQVLLVFGGAPRGAHGIPPVPSWLFSHRRDRWTSLSPAEWQRASWAWQRALVRLEPRRSRGTEGHRGRCMARLKVADPKTAFGPAAPLVPEAELGFGGLEMVS
jgi:hypothetical protein